MKWTQLRSQIMYENIMNRLPCLAYASNPIRITTCNRSPSLPLSQIRKKVVVCEDAIKMKFRRRLESSWPLQGNSLGHTLAHRLVLSRQEEWIGKRWTEWRRIAFGELVCWYQIRTIVDCIPRGKVWAPWILTCNKACPGGQWCSQNTGDRRS